MTTQTWNVNKLHGMKMHVIFILLRIIARVSLVISLMLSSMHVLQYILCTSVDVDMCTDLIHWMHKPLGPIVCTSALLLNISTLTDWQFVDAAKQ